MTWALGKMWHLVQRSLERVLGGGRHLNELGEELAEGPEAEVHGLDDRIGG